MPYIIEVDPPLHDRIRGLVARAFTPRRIAALEPRIERIAAELIDAFAHPAAQTSSRVSPGRCRSACSASSSACRADDLAHPPLGQRLAAGPAGPAAEERLEHARGLVELQRYFVDAVEARQRRPTDDLIGALVAATWSDDPLSVVEIAGLPLDLMVAGHVTVTRAIGSALDRLFLEPQLRDHLLDPALAPKAIEEILRLESPAQGLFRVTTREVELGGATLSGGRPGDGALRVGEPRRVRVRRGRRLPTRARGHRQAPRVRQGHPLLHRGAARPARARVALPLLLRRLPGLRQQCRRAAREPSSSRAAFRRCRWTGSQTGVGSSPAPAAGSAASTPALAEAGYGVVAADLGGRRRD